MTTKSNRCAFGLNALKNSDLITTADRIEKQLESTQAFSEIQPAPAEVRTVLEKFKEENANCEAGNRQKLGLRNQLREDLLALLRQQLRGVNYIAKDDIDLLEQSGFPIHKHPEPSGIPPMGQIIKVEPGADLGSFWVTVKGCKNRKFYKLFVQSGQEKPRVFEQSKTKFLVTGATPGEQVDITTRTFGAAGYGPVSNILTYTVPAGAPVYKAEVSDDDNKNMKVA